MKMTLKLLKVIFPGAGATGTVYTNSSNAFILVIQISVNMTGAGAVWIIDETGAAVGDIAKVYSYGLSGSITGSDTFNTNNSTTTGIANTTESLNENVNLSQLVYQVTKKVLIPPNYSIIAYQAYVNGFLAIQADSLEELRGLM
jgi:hypothetical protein